MKVFSLLQNKTIEIFYDSIVSPDDILVVGDVHSNIDKFFIPLVSTGIIDKNFSINKKEKRFNIYYNKSYINKNIRVIFLGDFLDREKKYDNINYTNIIKDIKFIDVYLFNTFIYLIDKKIPIISVIGNHETYYLSCLELNKILSETKNYSYIENLKSSSPFIRIILGKLNDININIDILEKYFPLSISIKVNNIIFNISHTIEIKKDNKIINTKKEKISKVIDSIKLLNLNIPIINFKYFDTTKKFYITEFLEFIDILNSDITEKNFDKIDKFLDNDNNLRYICGHSDMLKEGKNLIILDKKKD